MEWLKRMNGAIDYIENNLTRDIDFEEVSKVACCSSYHFQRMFSFITDTPLSEYIRRRRLILAAFELLDSNVKVIDLALKYGYESPSSFTRAFQNVHGVTPSAARKIGVKLKTYPPMSFHISIKGDVEMNYRIEEKEGFKVFGKSITIGIEDNPYEVIPRFWVEFQKDGTYHKICKTAGVEPYNETSMNAALYDFKNDGTYRNKYIINTLLPQGVEIPKELDILTIPKGKWVVFSAAYDKVEEATNAIQSLWKRAFAEWFPVSEYEVAEGPQLEVYPSMKEAEVWIPIVKK